MHTPSSAPQSTPSRASRPVLLSLHKEADRTKLDRLMAQHEIRDVIDRYEPQLRELFAVEHPSVTAGDFEQAFSEYNVHVTQEIPLHQHGTWVYFPWNGSLVHILDDADFQRVRMARNNPLLSDIEQQRFYSATISIAGLSVGNSVALAIVLQGGARHIKLADHDVLDLSNLNRIRASINILGISKVEITARQIYALNPYADVETFPQGLTTDNIESFVSGSSVLVDEMDSIEWKVRLREAARTYNIPLVSAADLDRISIIDIERYDQQPSPPFFQGRLAIHSAEDVKNLSKMDTGRHIAQLLGIENHTPRMLTALTQLGKTIVSWPQLGPTAQAGGTYITYCVERIINGKPLNSMRAVISLDQIFDPDYFDDGEVAERNEAIAAFQKIFAPDHKKTHE